MSASMTVALEKGPQEFLNCLDQWREQSIRMDLINCSSALHRCGKSEVSVPTLIVQFIADCVEQSPAEEKIQAQNVGNAIYGIRTMENSPEVHRLVQALTKKSGGMY